LTQEKKASLAKIFSGTGFASAKLITGVYSLKNNSLGTAFALLHCFLDML